MADTIQVKLSALEDVFQRGIDLGLQCIDGCVPEIGISTKHLTAFLAGNDRAIDGVVGPREFGAAGFAGK
ncbi:hypothetical protein LOC51_43395 [Rubrivivax sp. JA1024]|nr:hypothetical protein [Rubrivivax sp. JA1024]